MKMNASIVQPSRKRLSQMKDYTDDNAPSRESLGAEFWAHAQPRYPSRDRRIVRVSLDSEVIQFFANRSDEQEGINAVLRDYVEMKKAQKRSGR